MIDLPRSEPCRSIQAGNAPLFPAMRRHPSSQITILEMLRTGIMVDTASPATIITAQTAPVGKPLVLFEVGVPFGAKLMPRLLKQAFCLERWYIFDPVTIVHSSISPDACGLDWRKARRKSRSLRRLAMTNRWLEALAGLALIVMALRELARSVSTILPKSSI